MAEFCKSKVQLSKVFNDRLIGASTRYCAMPFRVSTDECKFQPKNTILRKAHAYLRSLFLSMDKNFLENINKELSCFDPNSYAKVAFCLHVKVKVHCSQWSLSIHVSERVLEYRHYGVQAKLLVT